MFKNAMFFRLTGQVDILEDDFMPDNDGVWRPIAKHEAVTQGFIPVLGDEYVMTLGAARFLKYRVEKKVVPAKYVNRLVSERIKTLTDLGQSVTKAQKAEIKDDVIEELLPTAPINTTDTYVYYCTKRNILMVDTASDDLGEAVCSSLRAVVGTLPAVPLRIGESLSGIMTGTVLGDDDRLTLGCEFMLGDTVVLDDRDGAQATFKGVDVTCKEVVSSIDNMLMEVTRLRLNHDDMVHFNLCENGVFRSIKWTDQFTESVDEFDGEGMGVDAVNLTLQGSLHLAYAELHDILHKLTLQFGVEDEL